MEILWLTGFAALVVDDNDFIRATLKKDLRLFGFTEVYEAANGMEALEMLVRNPDIIICDINMEPLNGFEFLKHVRALEHPKGKVPVIFLTGDAQAEQVKTAIDLSVDAYLLKPVTQENLRKKIVTLLQR
jgi:two-component system chemotaxis response regulator CheY